MKGSFRSASPDFHSPPRSHHLPHLEVKDDSSRAPLKPRDARYLSHDGESKKTWSAARVASPGEQYYASEAAEEIDRKRRSPSVVARLMGLDALPVSPVEEGGGESGWTELRRSASECRVSREAPSYRFLDGEMFPKRSPLETDRVSVDEWIRMANLGDIRVPEDRKPKFQAKTSRLPPLQRKSFFDADEFFPEPKKRGLLPIQLEKRHLIRGMDEASRDLETLKQILEALQLKGLLHSKPSGHQINGRRDRYARFSDYSPIVVIEPVPSPHMPPSTEPRQQVTFKSIAGRRNHVEEAVLPSLRQNRRVNQNPSSCNGTKDRAPSSSAKRRISNVVDSAKSLPPRPRTSTSIPPKAPPHRVGTIQTSGRPHSNRRQKQEATPKPRINSPEEENANATATTTTLDVEKSWAEDHRAGRQLLERCDQLLNSIAAFTAAEQVAVVVDPVTNAATERQPSPVSVLEVTSPPRSPLMKRSIDFEGEQLPDCEEEVVASNDGDGPAKQEDQEEGGQEDEDKDENDDDDDDYVYVAQVLRASDSAVKSVPLHRRLLFDAVAEILDKKRCSSHPPWESFVRPGSLSSASWNAAGPMLPEVWAELRRAREPVSADDVNVVTCLAARRDLEQDDRDTWARPAAEVAEAAIQIERLIFKDLLDGAIRDFADACPPQDAKPSKSNGRRGPITVNKRQ
ncbi:uncharacterized protein LOC141838526 [Curcuma longa]|uniref:uncharacterized protein LOC141838526 n=1 Tax=Curcuma longa TaxID=136217 RepID=UPI003D9EF5A9